MTTRQTTAQRIATTTDFAIVEDEGLQVLLSSMPPNELMSALQCERETYNARYHAAQAIGLGESVASELAKRWADCDTRIDLLREYCD